MAEETEGQGDTTPSADQQTEGAPAEETTLLTQGGDTEGEGGDTTESAEQAGEDGEGDGGEEAGVPDEYQFNMPEGMEVNSDLAEGISPLFRELELTQAQADKFISVYADVMQKQHDAAAEAFAGQLEEWASELKADKDLGGDQFEPNMAVARSAVEQFGSPELAEFLDSTGAGSHPAVVKFCYEIGKHLAEPGSGSGSGGGSRPKDRAERMYNPDGSPRTT